MRNNPLGAVVRHLRMRAGAAVEASSPDEQLLARFTESGDETAFAEIVRRHGPLVWALCRSALQTADAEDAFQATFVVLARRAANVRKPASLACWLSGVARRVIWQARRQLARGPTTGLPPDTRADDSPAAERDRREWRGVLDEELHRLPEKYRLPMVLCYYQGLTNEEAASRLGWPHGTVCGRLARARELLRRRLARRGVTLGAGVLAIHAVGPPSELLAVTFATCIGFVGTRSIGGKLGGSVLYLASGVIQTMWLEKVGLWAIGAAGLLAVGGAAGWVLVPAHGQTVPPATPAVPRAKAANNASPELTANFDPLKFAFEPSKLAAALATDDELQKLRKQCYESAHHELSARLQAFHAGTTQGTIDLLLGSIKRHLAAEWALSDRPKDQLNAGERSLSILKWVESVNDDRYRKGRIPIQDLEQSRFERLSLEINTLESKRAAEGRPGR